MFVRGVAQQRGEAGDGVDVGGRIGREREQELAQRLDVEVGARRGVAHQDGPTDLGGVHADRVRGGVQRGFGREAAREPLVGVGGEGIGERGGVGGRDRGKYGRDRGWSRRMPQLAHGCRGTLR